jgi:hypothetical protein
VGLGPRDNTVPTKIIYDLEVTVSDMTALYPHLAEPADPCARIRARIQRLADMLPDDVSFGYIGNCDGAGYDDRLWYLFLPHPGRVGTSLDRIGGFRTDDEEGARRCFYEVAGFVKGHARYAPL